MFKKRKLPSCLEDSTSELNYKKKRNRRDCTNCRDITITFLMGRLYGCVLKNRLEKKYTIRRVEGLCLGLTLIMFSV